METKNQNERNYSTAISEMRIIAHGADGFLLFPTRRNVTEAEVFGELHSHVYYEFFFAMNTPLTIVMETETQSFQNSVVIIPPHCKHVACGEGTDGYCIAVTAGKTSSLREHGLLDYVDKERITALPISEELAYYLKKLTGEDMFSRFGKAKGSALLQLIFLEIASLLSAKDTALRGEYVNPKYRYIEIVERFIEKNYNKPMATVANLAKELYVSERQVSRILKREYGRSFVELVNDKRMLVAGLLLKNTSLSVSAIITELGFETENYFYRTFKRYYGITPAKYRVSSV